MVHFLIVELFIQPILFVFALRYKNVLNIILSVIFLILYTIVVNNAQTDSPDWLEWLMYFWVAGYVLDELQQVRRPSHPSCNYYIYVYNLPHVHRFPFFPNPHLLDF